MKSAITVALLAFAVLSGCAAPNAAPLSADEQQYLYGTYAGQPQRPSLMN
jgi:hypothetical protein